MIKQAKCPFCRRHLVGGFNFTALDGTHPDEPRPGDLIFCDPKPAGCGATWTITEAGRFRNFTDAEVAAIEMRVLGYTRERCR